MGRRWIVAPYKTIPKHVLVAVAYIVAKTNARIAPVVFDTPVDCVNQWRNVPRRICGFASFARLKHMKNAFWDRFMVLVLK